MFCRNFQLSSVLHVKLSTKCWKFLFASCLAIAWCGIFIYSEFCGKPFFDFSRISSKLPFLPDFLYIKFVQFFKIPLVDSCRLFLHSSLWFECEVVVSGSFEPSVIWSIVSESCIKMHMYQKENYSSKHK